MDETLDSIPLKSTVQNVNISIVTHKELKKIDQDIHFVLDKIQKKIEVQKGGSPFK